MPSDRDELTGTVYAPIAPLDPYDVDEAALAKLARELTMNIRNYKVVFEDFGIDEDAFAVIERNPFFRKVREHFAQEWNSASSTIDRNRIKAAAYLEEVMPVIARRSMRDDTHLDTSINGGKLLAKIAGIGEKNEDNRSAERFVITINMGSDDGVDEVKTFDKSVTIDVTNGGYDGQTIEQGPAGTADERFRAAGSGEGQERQGERVVSDPGREPRPERAVEGVRPWHVKRKGRGKAQGEG